MGNDSVALRVAEVGERETGRKALRLGLHGLDVVDTVQLFLVHFEEVAVDVVLDRVVFLFFFRPSNRHNFVLFWE